MDRSTAIGNQHKPLRRVLVVARMSPRLNARTRRLVRALSREYMVEVVCESPSDLPPGDGGLPCDLRELSLSRTVGWPLHLNGLWRVLQLNFAALRSVFLRRPAVVVCGDSLYALPGVIASWIRLAGFVYDSHEVMWGMDVPAWLKRAMVWSEHLALRSANAWMVPSEERRDIIQGYYGFEKTCLVTLNLPDPVDREEERPRGFETLRKQIRSNGRPVVMFQGSLQENRGLEAMIELGRSGLAHVVIQGSGPSRRWVEDQAGRGVTVLPPCPGRDTVAWLGLADLSFVWYPSTTVNEQWACSQKLYASVFARVPVLANRLPAFESFSTRYGGIWFFDSLEPRALQSSVQDLLADARLLAELRAQMSKAREELEARDMDEEIRLAFRAWFPIELGQGKAK